MPDVKDKAAESALENFFGNIDVSDVVPKAGDDKPGESGKKETKDAVSKEEFERLQKEYNDLKSKYGASSAEAKRLLDKLQAVEPYMPILDLIQNDEGAYNALSNYIKGNQTVQDSVKAELGLSEDFEFNQQEAINNPGSDSAKVLQRMMEKTAQKVAKQTEQTVTQKMADKERKEAIRQEALALKAKFKLSDDELAEFFNKIKGYRPTLEDLFLALNKDKVQENLINNIVNEKLGPKNKQNRSVGKAGGGSEQSVEHLIMDTIINSDAGPSQSKELADFFKV